MSFYLLPSFLAYKKGKTSWKPVKLSMWLHSVINYEDILSQAEHLFGTEMVTTPLIKKQ